MSTSNKDYDDDDDVNNLWSESKFETISLFFPVSFCFRFHFALMLRLLPVDINFSCSLFVARYGSSECGDDDVELLVRERRSLDILSLETVLELQQQQHSAPRNFFLGIVDFWYEKSGEAV